MTEPSLSRLTEMCREFMAGLRTELAKALDGDPEVVIERAFGALAAAGAVVLMWLPVRRRDSFVLALLAAAARYLTGRSKTERS